MLDSHIIMLYTDALYRCPEESLPTYNEFRDMFSRSELLSNFWLVEELSKAHRLYDETIVIADAWFGLLGYLLRTKFIDVKVTCVDSDRRCEQFIKCLIPEYQPNRVQGTTSSLFDYPYSQDIVINANCEHLRDLSSWLNQIPSGKVVALRSSNNNQLKTNINCSGSLLHFKEQIGSSFSRILFAGENYFVNYSSYLVIGIKT